MYELALTAFGWMPSDGREAEHHTVNLLKIDRQMHQDVVKYDFTESWVPCHYFIRSPLHREMLWYGCSWVVAESAVL